MVRRASRLTANAKVSESQARRTSGLPGQHFESLKALIALGASVTILGSKGRRTTELAKFFKAPSAAPEGHGSEPTPAG